MWKIWVRRDECMKTIDVIIPTYKPGEAFCRLVDMLEKQSYPINKLIIMNTEAKYWEQLKYNCPRWVMPKNMEVHHLSRREFDHGRTRRVGVKHSTADYFVMMTQDAMPKDVYLIAHLVKALEEESVAVCYGRQLPGENSSLVEKYTRSFNYPETSVIKTKEDLPTLGIKTYFCSDVCAAYKRDIYEKQGGFIKRAIFNEDMIYAAGCIQAGYGVAYAADAMVIHSHDYTNKQQFHRNFDLGVSQAEHPEVFTSVKSESEGIRLVKNTASYLRENGARSKIFALYVTSAYKFLGYKLGKKYSKLPKRVVLKCTGNRMYFKQQGY